MNFNKIEYFYFIIILWDDIIHRKNINNKIYL